MKHELITLVAIQSVLHETSASIRRSFMEVLIMLITADQVLQLTNMAYVNSGHGLPVAMDHQWSWIAIPQRSCKF